MVYILLFLSALDGHPRLAHPSLLTSLESRVLHTASYRPNIRQLAVEWIRLTSPKDLRLTTRCISERCSELVVRKDNVSHVQSRYPHFAPIPIRGTDTHLLTTVDFDVWRTCTIVPNFSTHTDELVESTKKTLNNRAYFYANSNAGIGWTDKANRYVQLARLTYSSGTGFQLTL